jgi:peroxiredoxin family protein
VVAIRDNQGTQADNTLAILVSSDKHLDHVVNLTAAAFAKGKQVSVFFTGKGVLLTMQPAFKRLIGKASVSICDASFRANGMQGRENDLPGVTTDSFATQAKSAQMLADACRHLVF